MLVAILVEAEPRDRRLGQRSARTFAQHDDLRHQIGAGLVVRFVRTVAGDALVADLHPDDAVAVPQQLLPGEGGEDVDAGCFGLRGEPLGEVRERRDVLAVIVQHRRRERGLDLPAVGEEPERVAGDRRVEPAGDLFVREELVQGLRIDDGPGETVVPDLAALLDHHDRELDAGGGGQPAQQDRAGE